jgi:hypothetical protein
MDDAGRIPVGEVRLHRHLRPDLLAGGDEQRGVVRLRVEDRAHPVPDAGSGVQVDVGGTARGLREAVRHPDGDRLLEGEDVPEVLGELREHRQLRRAGVAEHRRHPVRAEEFERRFPDRRHGPGAYSA